MAKNVKLAVYVDRELETAIRQAAENQNEPRSEWIRTAIKQRLDQEVNA